MSNNKTALINRTSAIYINDDNSININTNNTLSLAISGSQTIGIGADPTTDALLIKSTTGGCLTLTKNNINSSTFQINDAGQLTITSISTTLVNNINISSHNGSTIGLALAGNLITATANQINRTNTTAGTGDDSTNRTFLTNTTAGITSIIADIPMNTNISITSKLTATASTTSYSLALIGIQI